MMSAGPLESLVPAWSPRQSRVGALVLTVNGQSKIACDPDNGGIDAADGILCAGRRRRPRRGAAPRGRAEWRRRTSRFAGGGRRGGVSPCVTRTATAASRSRRSSAADSTTGIALRNGYLYVAHPKSVERYKMTPGS